MTNRVFDTQRAAGGNAILDTRESAGVGAGEVSFDFTGSYSVVGAVSIDFAGSYAVLQKVEASFEGSYEIAGQISAISIDFPGQYSIRSAITASWTFQYDIGTVTFDLPESRIYKLRAERRIYRYV